METLNKVGLAVAQRRRSMTAGARLAVILLIAVAIASVALLAGRDNRGPEMALLGGEAISADQIPRIEAAFAKAGLSDYRIEGGRVHIPRSRNTAYMAALAAADALPRHFGDSLDRAIDKTNLFMSRSQQEELIKNARQNELAAIIQKMKGIEQASVLYDRERKSGLTGGEIITASVTVKVQEHETLRREQVISIRKLVSGAIAGLDARNIAVIDLSSGRSHHGELAEESPNVVGVTYVERSQEPAPSAPARQIVAKPVSEVMAGTAIAWHWASRNSSTLLLGGLALVGLLCVRSIIRPAPAPAASVVDEAALSRHEQPVPTPKPTDSEPLPSPVGVVAEPAASPGERGVPTPSPQLPTIEKDSSPHHRTRHSEPRLPEKLAEIVRDDPRTAARVLRSWIGSPN